ncbi:MAG: phosphatidylserine decarboxylase [Gammaproteobacteria bacterium]
MNRSPRNRSAAIRSRLASSLDLLHARKRSQDSATATVANRAYETERTDETLPPQSPPFLADLPPVGAEYIPQQHATKTLKTIIDENYYATNFEEAIKIVSAQKIPELDRIKTLNQFYYYVDALVTWIPEIRVWKWDGETLHERTVYLRITQFYYYFNQPQLDALQSPIAPIEEDRLSPLSNWLRAFAVEWGNFLDTPASKQYLESFKYAPEYAWQDYEKEPQDYETFNAYFARQFKDIDVQRPVASENDDRVVVFPAESTFVGQWPVSTPVGEPLPAAPSIVVKNIEWSIAELLKDSEYAADFEGGIFCHSFLNTYDYHRQHTPVAGKVLEAKFIPGQVYLQVDLQEQDESDENGNVARAVIPQRYLNAEDPTGYQFVQCRGLLVLDSAIGKVAVLPMGMAQVSSVVFVTPKDEGHKPITLSPAETRELSYHERQRERKRPSQHPLPDPFSIRICECESVDYYQYRYR